MATNKRENDFYQHLGVHGPGEHRARERQAKNHGVVSGRCGAPAHQREAPCPQQAGPLLQPWPGEIQQVCSDQNRPQT